MFKNTIATQGMQIKTTLRIYPTPVQMAIVIKIRTNNGEVVAKGQALYTVGRNVNLSNKCGHQYQVFSKH